MRRLIICLMLAVPLLSACQGSDPSAVVVLVADAEAPGQALDEDDFKEGLATLCDGCRAEFHDAGGDAETQREQVTAAVESGVGAILIEPVDPEIAEEFALASEKTPLVAIGSFVPGADLFVGVTEPVVEATYDTDLAAAQALVDGDLDSFQHVPTGNITADAATVAAHLLAKEKLEAPVEYEGVPSWIHEPVDVSLANLTSVLVGPGLVSLDEICEGREKKCSKLGLV